MFIQGVALLLPRIFRAPRTKPGGWAWGTLSTAALSKAMVERWRREGWAGSPRIDRKPRYRAGSGIRVRMWVLGQAEMTSWDLPADQTGLGCKRDIRPTGGIEGIWFWRRLQKCDQMLGYRSSRMHTWLMQGGSWNYLGGDMLLDRIDRRRRRYEIGFRIMSSAVAVAEIKLELPRLERLP